MPKLVDHLDIGRVVLTKRRNSRNIRLSVKHSGVISVSLPKWLPYEAGMIFVRKNRQWILKNLQKRQQKYSDEEITRFTKKLVSEAKQILPGRLQAFAQKHGYKASEVKVRKMTSRWGSCTTKGKITLSIYLLKLPEPLIDYVLCHELAHLKEHGHQRGFWQVLGRIYPDYKKARKEIRNYSPRVD